MTPLEELSSNVPERTVRQRPPGSIASTASTDSILRGSFSTRSRLPRLSHNSLPNAAGRVSKGGVSHSIGPDLSRRSSTRASEFSPRRPTTSDLRHYRSNLWPSNSPHHLQRPTRELSKASAYSPRLSFRNETTAIVQSMPGAFPDGDIGPNSIRSSAEMSNAQAVSSGNNSIQGDVERTGGSTAPEVGPDSHLAPELDRQRSIPRSISPAYSETSSHRSYRRRTSQRSRPMRGNPTFPSSFQQRSFRPQHHLSYVHPRPGPLQSRWPHRLGPYQASHANEYQQFPEVLREEQDEPSFASTANAISEDFRAFKDESPRYYDYSEGFVDRVSHNRRSVEPTPKSSNAHTILEEESSPVNEENQCDSEGEVDLGDRNSDLVERKSSDIVHVPDAKQVRTNNTNQKPAMLQHTSRDGLSRLSQTNLIPQELKVARKSDNTCQRLSLKRRSTVSLSSVSSFQFEHYEREQSRDDLSLIASLYASSKFLGDADYPSQQQSTSPRATNRSSLGSLSKHLSSSLLWYQEKSRHSLKSDVQGRLSSYAKLPEESKSDGGQRSTEAAQPPSNTSSPSQNGSSRHDLEEDIRPSNLELVSAADRTAARLERPNASSLPEKFLSFPEKSVSFSTSDIESNQKNRRLGDDKNTRSLGQTKVTGGVGRYPLSRTPSPSRPWTLSENYPWFAASIENLQIKNPLLLGPLPPTPTRSSRFKLRVSRPSTSIAGSSTLDSFSLRSKAGSSNEASPSSDHTGINGNRSRQSTFFSNFRKRFSKPFFPDSSTIVADVESPGPASPTSRLSRISQTSDTQQSDLLQVPSRIYSPISVPTPKIIHTPPMIRRPVPRRSSRPSSSSLWSASAPPSQRTPRRSSWIALDDLDNGKSPRRSRSLAPREPIRKATTPMPSRKYHAMKINNKIAKWIKEVGAWFSKCAGRRSESKPEQASWI